MIVQNQFHYYAYTTKTFRPYADAIFIRHCKPITICLDSQCPLLHTHRHINPLLLSYISPHLEALNIHYKPQTSNHTHPTISLCKSSKKSCQNETALNLPHSPRTPHSSPVSSTTKSQRQRNTSVNSPNPSALASSSRVSTNQISLLSSSAHQLPCGKFTTSKSASLSAQATS